MNKISSILFLVTIVTSFIAYWHEEQTQENDVLQHNLNSVPGEISIDQIHRIHVQQWAPHAPTADVFEAQLKQGMWHITSHHDFPADLSSRIGQIIGAVINLKRGPLISADPSRHFELRVVDPEDKSAINSRSFGQRISLFDKNNNRLLDLIFGRYDQELERSYVRHADESEVYTTTAFLYLEAHWLGWVKQQLIEHSFEDVIETQIQALADKPFQTTNIFALDNETNLWKCNGTPCHTPQVSSFLDFLLSVKLLNVLPLTDDTTAHLATVGFVFENNQVTDAPIKHLIKTRDGATYQYFISNPVRLKNRNVQFVVMTLTPGQKSSASYRYRCKHFAFIVDPEFLTVLNQLPADLLPAE